MGAHPTELIEAVLRMRDDKQSFTVIAREVSATFKCNMTRSAVAGILMRRRPKPIAKPRGKFAKNETSPAKAVQQTECSTKTAVIPPAQAIVVVKPVVVRPPRAAPRRITELESCDCRYPTDEVDANGVAYIGFRCEELAEPNQSWCKAHMKKVFTDKALAAWQKFPRRAA